jgi:predicted ATPase
LVQEQCGVRPRRVIRKDGATWIDGMRLTGLVDDGEED